MGNQQVSTSPTVEVGVDLSVDDKMDLTSEMKNLNLKPKKDINILLLGETGIGKSTFINSIFNYLHYNDFEKAENDRKLTVLIPSMFTCFDKNNEAKSITVGSTTDKNELLSIGESATQDVKTYTFKIQHTNTMVRLIDTPGMGDTDGGLEKDNIHCENILSYISGLKELQAICFLFKPKTTRLTAFFKYCMDQILSRLEKSASQNLVFVFTNTRGDDYSPGDTFSILKRVVKEIEERPPHVKIPLNNNVFCFDNEAFRYLAAVKEGVQFFSNYRKCCKESWEKSTQECWKMISYIDKLSPHLVQQTSAINEARRMIYQLSQPMVEIAQLINDNLYVLNRHQAHLSIDNQSLVEMKKKLYIPVVNLKVIKLTQPVTVCTDAECAEVYKVEEVNKWHYKQRCHDPCYLKNVPKEIVGSPELINCAAINSSTQMCNKCSHRYSVHMHVYYMTETVQDQQLDQTISQSINTKELVLENARKVIKNIQTKKNELQAELDTIIRCNAQFAHFLQHNAITPFSDSYAEYIQHLIIREKSLGNQANPETLRNFRRLLDQHNVIKGLFDKALQESQILGTQNDKTITPEIIRKSIEDLYKLKHNGQKVQELYHSQNKSREKEHAHTEYVHYTPFTKSAPQETRNEPDNNRNPRSNTQSQNQRGRGNYRNNKGNRHNTNPYQRSHSHGPQNRKGSPPPTYDDSLVNNRSRQSRPPAPPRGQGYDYRGSSRPQSYHPPPPPPPPQHDPPYVAPAKPYPYRPPTYDRQRDREHSYSGSDSNRPKSTEPTIQVNLNLPSRDSVPPDSSRLEDRYYHRDAHPAPSPPHYGSQDPYYRRDDPSYRSEPPRDYYPPRDVPRDSYYPPRDPPTDYYYAPRDPPRDPYYYPPRDYYPPREPNNYPPRDHYYPNDPSYRREHYAAPPRDHHYGHHDNAYGSHNNHRGGEYDHRGRGNYNRGRGANYRGRHASQKSGYDSDCSASSRK